MRDGVEQNVGYCWGFERMHQARTLQPRWVRTTAPSSLDTRKPGAAGATVSSLGTSALLSWAVTGICGELPAVCRMRTKVPWWPVLYFQLQLSSWSLLLRWPSARGIIPQNQPDALFPMPLLPLLLVLRTVFLTNADLFLKAQFRNPFFLEDFCTFAIFTSWSPGRADAPLLWALTEFYSTSSMASIILQHLMVSLPIPLLDSKHPEGKGRVKHISGSLASMPGR